MMITLKKIIFGRLEKFPAEIGRLKLWSNILQIFLLIVQNFILKIPSTFFFDFKKFHFFVQNFLYMDLSQHIMMPFLSWNLLVQFHSTDWICWLSSKFQTILPRHHSQWLWTSNWTIQGCEIREHKSRMQFTRSPSF